MSEVPLYRIERDVHWILIRRDRCVYYGSKSKYPPYHVFASVQAV